MAKNNNIQKRPLYFRAWFILLSFILSIVLLLVIAGVSAHFEISLSNNADDVQTVFADGFIKAHEAQFHEDGRPKIHGFFSRAEHNNHTVYFLGSMHYGRPEWFPLAPIVEEAMARTDVFAFEVDMEVLLFLEGDIDLDDWDFDNLNFDEWDFDGWDFDDFDLNEWDIDDFDFDEWALDMFMNNLSGLGGDFDMLGIAIELERLSEELSILPGNTTLEDVLPSDIFSNFIEMLDTYKYVTYEDIMFLTPVAAAQFISTVEVGHYIDIYRAYSVDHYISNFANENNRPSVGLTNFASEISFRLDIPMAIQAEAFRDFTNWVTFFVQSVSYVNALIEAYETQNAEAIRHLITTAFQDAPSNAYVQFEEATLTQRSRIFGQEVMRLLNETTEPTTFFVTVGAAHILSGNVFSVLEENGIEIVPLW